MAFGCTAAKNFTYFRSKDPLENFRIKVVLRKIVSSSSSVAMETTDDEIQEFKWQLKLFSKNEEARLTQMPDDISLSLVERQRKQQLLKQLSDHNGQRPNGRLFSLIQGDGRLEQLLLNTTALTNAGKEKPTYVSQLEPTLRRRGRSRGGVTYPVLEKPSEDQRKQNRLITPHRVTMVIMADLAPFNSNHSDEHIIQVIQVDDSGVIRVCPDFNTELNSWYRIENRNQEVFEYTLEHSSKAITNVDLNRERGIVSELNRQRLDQLSSALGKGFTPPPEVGLLVVTVGQLVSVKDFEYDDLYVKVTLHLPNGWHCEEFEGQESSLYSQICRVRSDYMVNTANFALPLEFTLQYRPLQVEDELVLEQPTLYFEVSSIDSWERHRIEGYGYWKFPWKPGMVKAVIPTWRPAPRSYWGALQRFFIGGDPALEDVLYTATPPDSQGDHLAKYGFVTETSGTITLHMSLIHQSHASQLRYGFANKAVTLTTDAILDVYKKTKNKLASTLRPAS